MYVETFPILKKRLITVLCTVRGVREEWGQCAFLSVPEVILLVNHYGLFHMVPKQLHAKTGAFKL